jgi:hypothetical protein
MDSQRLGDWCEENGDFLKSVVEELREYFLGEGSGARSFVSKPLYQSGGPFAVVNIQADRPDLLGPDPQRRAEFLQLIEPILTDLGSILALLIDRERQHG